MGEGSVKKSRPFQTLGIAMFDVFIKTNHRESPSFYFFFLWTSQRFGVGRLESLSAFYRYTNQAFSVSPEGHNARKWLGQAQRPAHVCCPQFPDGPPVPPPAGVWPSRRLTQLLVYDMKLYEDLTRSQHRIFCGSVCLYLPGR